jgi:hypothetical protein
LESKEILQFLAERYCGIVCHQIYKYFLIYRRAEIAYGTFLDETGTQEGNRKKTREAGTA